MASRCALVVLLCALPTCQRQPVKQVQPGQLVASPLMLALPDVYVGQSVSGDVQVTNVGEETVTADVSVDAPFTVALSLIDVGRGETSTVTLHFTPAAAGSAQGTLHIGLLSVVVTAEALDVPACAGTVCTDARFDAPSGQCVTTPKPENTACATTCILGQCHLGQCLGQPTSCDDGDACTVDACNDDVGCTHLPRTCPAPGGSCQAAICDSTVGCGAADALDGTLCGADDCRATTVDVCITGQCVTRPRPNLGRCTNTWMPLFLTPRYNFAVAFDSARGRTVLFGGQLGTDQSLGDTWEWDGTRWTLQTPASSPPARHGHAMAYDPFRQRVVLFGGSTLSGLGSELNDTWEWDGKTWVQRVTSTAPAPRFGHAMAFDTLRARLVLMGGAVGGGPVADTWEWNGGAWTQRVAASPMGPRVNHAMAYDAVHHRVVLFGGEKSFGGGGDSDETWLWDGTSWTQPALSESPTGRGYSAMTWDAAQQRVVLVGGIAAGHPADDTWDWDGAGWTQRTPATGLPENYGGALVFDDARRMLVLVGGRQLPDLQTWELGTNGWTRVDEVQPIARHAPAVAWDSTRARLVMFGGWATGYGNLDDTWEWDGAQWLERAQMSLTPRCCSGAAWDPTSQRMLIFGGGGTYLDLGDTWAWDGNAWRQPASTGPSARSTTMVQDVGRQRTVLFGGEQDHSGSAGHLGDTWEFDGTAWQQRTPATSPSPRTTVTAYDELRQRVIVFGGAVDDGGESDETWSWDGGTWTQLSPTTRPPKRRFHAMAYDPARQLILMFGGYPDTLDDTWEWDGTNWSQRMPEVSPPPTDEAAMVYDAVNQHMVIIGPTGMWWFLP